MSKSRMKKTVKRVLIGAAFIFCAASLLVEYGWFETDYKSSKDLLRALDANQDVVGKTVMVDIKDYHYTGLVYYFKPNDRLDFISPKNPKFKEGRTEVVEIAHVQPVADHYIIGYKLEGDDYDNKAH